MGCLFLIIIIAVFSSVLAPALGENAAIAWAAGIVIGSVLLIWLIQTYNEECRKEKYRKKNNIPKGALEINKCLKLKEIEEPCYIWKEEDRLMISLSFETAWKKYGRKYEDEKIIIPIENIQYYTVLGENKFIEEDGGFSVLGAAIGASALGTPGAIIGGNMPNEIKQVEKKKTMLIYEIEDEVRHLMFNDKGHEVLLEIIPKKDAEYITMNETLKKRF